MPVPAAIVVAPVIPFKESTFVPVRQVEPRVIAPVEPETVTHPPAVSEVTGVALPETAVTMPDEETVRFAQLYDPAEAPELMSENVVLPEETLEVTFPVPVILKVVPAKALTVTVEIGVNPNAVVTSPDDNVTAPLRVLNVETYVVEEER